MKIKKVIPQKLLRKEGVSAIFILIGVIMLGIIIIPLTRWYSIIATESMIEETRLNEINERLEMQSLLLEYWRKLNTLPYDEFEEEIKTKGTIWDSTLEGKYSIRTEIGKEGKYENAQCNTTQTAGAEDKHCRVVNMLLTKKENNSLAEQYQTTRISTAGGELNKIVDGGEYIKFDNGLVIQFGSKMDVALDETWHQVSFPIRFNTRTAGISVTISPQRGKGMWRAKTDKRYLFIDGDVAPMATNITQTGMRVGADLFGGSLDVGYVYGNIYWLSIGY